MHKISFRSHIVENSKCTINGSYFIFIQGFHCVPKEPELDLGVFSLQLSAFIPCEAFTLGVSCFHRIIFPTMLLGWILMLNNEVPDTQTHVK